MTASAPVPPRPAAAIVLMRPAPEGTLEVFMVRRHAQSSFAPDVFVFPGGSVAPGDRDAELAATTATTAITATTAGAAASAAVVDDATAPGSGFRAAAIRECFEEAGVLLARRGAEIVAIGADDVPRFAAYRAALQQREMTLGAVAEAEGLALATDALTHWAHWITPEAFPKRFDTLFFLAAMPAEQEAAHDQLETTASVWINPGEALARFEAGTFPLVFAQIHQLRALAPFASLEEARAHYTANPPRTIMPRVVRRDGTDVILLPDEE